MKCTACQEEIKAYTGLCPYCGTDGEAITEIVKAGLHPNDVYEELFGRPGFYRLTVEVAKLAIEAMRLTHERPH